MDVMSRYPKAIKVTSDFMQILEAKCMEEIILVDTPRGAKSKFMGLPLIVDDTINHPYYEFVY
jgi:hypothetical protein